MLAFVAGSINAIGLLGFEHQAVSHVSGTATLLGTSFLNGSYQNTVHLGGVLISFFLGAAISGYLVHGATLKLGRHYDTALVLEGCLILASYWLLSNGSFYGHFAASVACGMQNALATAYSGAVVRTTHLTGIFTDLGILVGSVLRGDSFDKRKLLLFSLIIAGFVIGGLCGAYLFALLGFKALLLPGTICFVLALWYRLYSKKYGSL
ncbi:YoaK family protein [Seongchinamella sediminis]|uniref:YoaK family protein n=1 Tax=Seongchinamella sediminis TaxID=2283635 RepID=UPI001EF1040D|nr:YoaK family protein [Seongchinamella sediminis]